MTSPANPVDPRIGGSPAAASAPAGMLDRYLDAVVLDRRALTDRITELRIGAADGSSLPMAEAGSHIELRFGGTAGYFLRHYSVVGPLAPDTSEPFWRIAVQRENRARGSAFIHENFRRGTHLRVSRPIGSFRLGRNLPHALLIAGGIGVTPMVPMLRSLVVRKQSHFMLFAGRRRADMAYVDEVEALGGDGVRIHQSDLDGPPDLDELLAWQPEGTVVFVCGPGPMIDAVRGSARRLGWDSRRVRYEVFNAAHHDADTDFSVRLRTGQVIPVGAGTTILDALEAARVDTLSDCRRGECGLCITEVLDPHEGIDHRDSYLTLDERAEATQIAICCSRAQGALLDLDIS